MLRSRDGHEAGIQVPTGPVHGRETPETAAVRTLRAETGQGGFTLSRKLGEVMHDDGRRHFFLFDAPGDLPARWSQYGENRYWFDYSWVPLEGQIELADGQGEFLDLIR